MRRVASSPRMGRERDDLKEEINSRDDKSMIGKFNITKSCSLKTQ